MSGLGGHDDCASGVDKGVKKSSTPLWKRGRSALPGHATFSGFVGADNQFVSENRNDLNGLGEKKQG